MNGNVYFSRNKLILLSSVNQSRQTLQTFTIICFVLPISMTMFKILRCSIFMYHRYLLHQAKEKAILTGIT